MMLRDWNELPQYMRTEEVRPYYDILMKKQTSLRIKRAFDFVMALFLLVILSPLFLVISIMIIKDSKGGVFYRQERITQYGKKFWIFKFRTMVANADKIGTQVTVQNDSRITVVGEKLRKYRLDEIPQLLNIIGGDMSFVGTRPEATKYVKKYSKEMMATLLLPAGVTSEASIKYKDEAKLLDLAEDADKVYVEDVLPNKMKYNLDSLRKFNCFRDLKTMIGTVVEVMR